MDSNLYHRDASGNRRSLAKLPPLKDRLTATDRLIDQIVYRLYSLTEEEIKMVGRGTG
jgi:hypothetical protein